MTKDNILARYWRAYGGLTAIMKSIYFWSAIFLTALLYPAWMEADWWDDVLAIMPSLLGFSLGGFAMWVAIGDEKFKRLIAGEDKPEEGEKAEASPFMQANATFAHFILLQLLSILLALIAKSYNFVPPSDHWLLLVFGENLRVFTLVSYASAYFVFLYALMTAFAAVLALFRVSSWYDDMHTINNANQQNYDE